ncbi:DUF4238 domain-containing protein [Microbacterium sp. NPDC008134]|uniref:DUF4238 domain-containing protein n=1 Tax=Microbacterium sp. NPDC008134 TaxID=3364183 RepID=UPI0036E20A7E
MGVDGWCDIPDSAQQKPVPCPTTARAPADHYIARTHMRRWATNNRVSVLQRGKNEPQLLDVGRAVAAERGLNDPSIEAAYGRIENRFSKTLERLLDRSSSPTDRDWNAVREYATLVHDRYPALRGSAVEQNALPGGNIMMVPDPANWGGSAASDSLDQLATSMDRESLKALRLQMLGIAAQLLPRFQQVFYVGPMLLGDAGIHAITLHPEGTLARTYVAMPLASDAMIVFGHQLPEDSEVSQIAQTLIMKTALHSTVVIDTIEAPLLNTLVTDMWKHQPEPVGTGAPKAIHLYDSLTDIPH